MRKALWIPVCLLLFWGGDRLGGYLMGKLTEASEFRYARMYGGAAAAEILLLGNSRGLIFYQPYIEATTHKKTFNLSYNSMPIDLGRVLVEDYLDRYNAPELLVIDVTMCDRYNEKLVAGFSPYTKYSEKLGKLIKEQSPKSWYAGHVSHLYRYNSEVFQRTLYYLKKSDEDWLNDRIISPTMQDNVAAEEAHELSVDDYLLGQLKAIIDAAENAGTQVELVVNPYYPPYVQRMRTFYDFIGKIEAETGKTVRDYSRDLEQTDGFADYQHLNKAGSKRYIDLLLRDGVFKKKMKGEI